VRKLSSFLHTFGWGIDMAYADSFLLDADKKRTLTAQDGYAHYTPGERGRLQNVPAAGYLDDLAQAYDRQCKRLSKVGVDPSTRATKYAQARYRKAGALESPHAAFILRRLTDENSFYNIP